MLSFLLQSLVPPPAQHATPSTDQSVEDSEAPPTEEQGAEKEETMETSTGEATETSKGAETMETASKGEGEFDNILGNFEVERKRHDPTIPAEVMDDIQQMKEGDDPDDDEGGVASSDEEVVT